MPLKLLAGIIAILWAGYLAAGRFVCEWIVRIQGDTIMRLGKGRITDIAEFLHDVMFESVFLATIILLLACVTAIIWIGCKKKISGSWLWLPMSLVVFVNINILIAFASETSLYWLVLYVGGPNLKQSGFHVERMLLKKDRGAEAKAIVLGSSQGQSQVHIGELNKRFWPKIRFGNLSYAGAQAFDFLLIQDHYKDISADLIICYVSELNFYIPVSGKRYVPMLTLSGLKTLKEHNILRFGVGEELYYAGIAIVLPLFRSRRAIEMFAFGEVSGWPKRQVVVAGKAPQNKMQRRETQARKLAIDYTLGPDSDFQKESFLEFLRTTQGKIKKVVIIGGQVNPILAAKISPEVLTDFQHFVKGLSNQFANTVVLIDELPRHSPQDYDDLMHITPETRLYYTHCLADILEEKLEVSAL